MSPHATTGTTSPLAEVVSALTTVRQPAEDDLAGHLAMLRDMRDREAIRDLATLYTRAVDNYDLDTLVDLFTEDGVFERRGKPVVGRDALRETYAGAMQANRTMVHTPDSHVVELLPGRRGRGWAAGHAELVMGGKAVVAAFRYEDEYRCVDDRWRFARRSIRFMYAAPVDEIGTSLTGMDRMRWPGVAPATADYPEDTPTWSAFHD